LVRDELERSGIGTLYASYDRIAPHGAAYEAPPSVLGQAFVVLLLGISAAPSPRHQGVPPPSSGPGNVVNIIAEDFLFVAPESIPAGLTTFQLTQAGKFGHDMSIVQLQTAERSTSLCKWLPQVDQHRGQRALEERSSSIRRFERTRPSFSSQEPTL
jgi:hypothetical protein